MRQDWIDLAYFHWRYDPAIIQATLPPGLRVDTFDDSAWIGLIPFVMRDVCVGPLPPLPRLDTFVEVNVRTYVVDDEGRRAVWFYSLDVPRTVIVAAARTVFCVPYCWAKATHMLVAPGTDGPIGERHRYEVRRRWPAPRSAHASISYTVGEPIEGDALAHFLSARWALSTTRRNRVRYGRVEHPRWPLHAAENPNVDESLIAAAELPTPTGPMHTMCSPGVAVQLAWFS